MPAITAQASILVDAPLKTVHEALADFHGWPDWSPWLYVEPDAQLTFRGEPGTTGHGYNWSGDRVGAGSMDITAIDRNRLAMNLSFLKPFRSTADVSFELAEQNDSTRVTWGMHSKLPFFLFFMSGTMNAMIRADYRRGLRMLKDLIETGRVPSTTTSGGTVNMPEAHYIGHGEHSSMSELPKALEHSYGIAGKAAWAAGRDVIGPPFSLYHSMNLKQASCRYTAALPIDGPLDASVSIEPPATADGRPACRALKFVHTGAYRHLPNAWSALHAELRATGTKPARGVSPFEIYTNDPENTPEAELVTEIYMPLRG